MAARAPSIRKALRRALVNAIDQDGTRAIGFTFYGIAVVFVSALGALGGFVFGAPPWVTGLGFLGVAGAAIALVRIRRRQ